MFFVVVHDNMEDRGHVMLVAVTYCIVIRHIIKAAQ